MTTGRASTIRQMAEHAMLEALVTDSERRSDAERQVPLSETRILDRQHTFIYFAEQFGQAVAAAVAARVEREYEHNTSVVESLRQVERETRERIEALPRAIVKGGMLSVQSTWVENECDQLVRLQDVLTAIRASEDGQNQ